MMEQISKSIEETAEIAKKFGSSLGGAHQGVTVVGLYGELGAGKTTFMKYLAEYFGIKETIQSPTFVIMKIYKTPPPHSRVAPPLGKGRGWGEVRHLIHIDAYRIEKESEMLNLGWEKLIADPKNLICVEWPERIIGIIPNHIKIFFEHINENKRKITIQK